MRVECLHHGIAPQPYRNRIELLQGTLDMRKLERDRSKWEAMVAAIAAVFYPQTEG